jgi:[ribosomal protein S5]-alanine N-acetyltransferase
MPNAPANPFAMAVLTTPRLRIRPLEPNDLQSCCDLFASIGWNDPTLGAEEIIARRQSWLTWTIAGYRELERLYQPPLGERAVVSRDDDRFIGLVGYVPSFEPFQRLRSFGENSQAGRTMELGMFWALHKDAHGQGCATEAATALITHAFTAMAVDRIIATTRHDNLASIAVMRRLKMNIDVYGQPHPGLQVVGTLRASET